MGNIVTKFFMSLNPIPTLRGKRKALDIPETQLEVKKIKKSELIDEVPDCIKERLLRGACTFCGVVKKRGIVQGICSACQTLAFQKQKKSLTQNVNENFGKEERNINEHAENIVERQVGESDDIEMFEDGVNIDVVETSQDVPQEEYKYKQVKEFVEIGEDTITKIEDNEKGNVEHYGLQAWNKESEHINETGGDMELQIVDALTEECPIKLLKEPVNINITELVTEEITLELQECEVIKEAEKLEKTEEIKESTEEIEKCVDYEIIEDSIEAPEELEDFAGTRDSTEITEKYEDSKTKNYTAEDFERKEIEDFKVAKYSIEINEEHKDSELTNFSSKLTEEAKEVVAIEDHTEAIEEPDGPEVINKSVEATENLGESVEIFDETEENGIPLETLANQITEEGFLISQKEFFHNFLLSVQKNEKIEQKVKNIKNRLDIIEDKLDKVEQTVQDSQKRNKDEYIEVTTESIIEERKSLSFSDENSISSSLVVEIDEDIVSEEFPDTDTANEEENETKTTKFDTLVLRNRTITETLSPIYEENNKADSSKEELTAKIMEKSDEDISTNLDEMKKDTIPKRISRIKTLGSSSSKQPQRESRTSKRGITSKTN